MTTMNGAPRARTPSAAAAAAALLLAALATPAAAEPPRQARLMLGGAGGVSSYDDRCDGLTRCDTSSRALRVNAGIAFPNGIALEVVGYDFGRLTGASGGVSAELRATALGAGFVFQAPPFDPDVALFVRAGLAQVRAKASARLAGFTTADEEKHAAGYAGIGLAWLMGEHAALELSYEASSVRYGGERVNVGAVLLGASLRF